MKLILSIFLFLSIGACSTLGRTPSNDLSNPEEVRVQLEKDRQYYQDSGLAESLRMMSALRIRAERELNGTHFWQVGKKSKLKKVIERLRTVTNSPEKLFELKIMNLEEEVEQASRSEKSTCKTDEALHVRWAAACVYLERKKKENEEDYKDSKADYHESLRSEYGYMSGEILTFLATVNVPDYPNSFITQPQEDYLIGKVVELQQKSHDHHQRAVANKSSCKDWCSFLDH